MPGKPARYQLSPPVIKPEAIPSKSYYGLRNPFCSSSFSINSVRYSPKVFPSSIQRALNLLDKFGSMSRIRISIIDTIHQLSLCVNNFFFTPQRRLEGLNFDFILKAVWFLCSPLFEHDLLKFVC